MKQAFVQATLLLDKQYFLCPPAGCPRTPPPKTYWLLKRTLYELKRSPKHWFNRAKSLLPSLNLTLCPNALCIFHGEIIPGRPPLYLGLYVDYFVYFYQDPSVEKEFKENFGKINDG